MVPQEGGRIASLRSVLSGVEFLTQARRDRPAFSAGIGASFQHGPCAGAEECLPTVGPCTDSSGGPVPDHGDFWQTPWQVDFGGEKRLVMHAAGFSRPLRFEKVVEVNEASISLGYKIVNRGVTAVTFLYAWHPLFAVEAGDRVVLPAEANDLMLTYSRDEELLSGGRQVRWPLLKNDKATRDLSVGAAAESGTAEMLYTRKLAKGRCGLFRQQHGQGVIVSFDTSRLPYLGMWLCYGGWPFSGAEPKQVAVALEPTTAPCNTLSEAERSGFAISLAPEQSFEWNLQVELTQPGLDYPEFLSRVDGP